jgi:hypothetical protein
LDIYERVLSTVEHHTNNRVHGPTTKRPIVKRLVAHTYDAAAVVAAIDELLRDGELIEPEQDRLALLDDQ